MSNMSKIFARFIFASALLVAIPLVTVSSAYAQVVTVPLHGAPTAPTDFSVAPGHEEAILSWNTPDDGGSPITGYKIASKEADGVFSNFELVAGSNADTTEHTVTGLTNGVTYTFKILAVNSVGDGAESREVSAVPAPTQVTVGYEFPAYTVTRPQGSVTYCVVISEPISDGTVPFALPVSSGGTPAPFTLQSSIEGGTAIAGVDYTAPGDQLLVFNEGDRRRCYTISINDVTSIGKTIFLRLTPVSNDPSIAVNLIREQLGVLINGSDATLRELSLSDTSGAIALSPAFASSTLTYTADVAHSITSLDIRAVVNDMGGVSVPPRP